MLILAMTLQNRPPLNYFQASQCIPMDPDAAADTAAAVDADTWCVHTLSLFPQIKLTQMEETSSAKYIKVTTFINIHEGY